MPTKRTTMRQVREVLVRRGRAQRDCPPSRCCAVDCPIDLKTTGECRVELAIAVGMTRPRWRRRRSLRRHQAGHRRHFGPTGLRFTASSSAITSPKNIVGRVHRAMPQAGFAIRASASRWTSASVDHDAVSPSGGGKLFYRLRRRHRTGSPAASGTDFSRRDGASNFTYFEAS
jgi:hypothetical protein